MCLEKHAELQFRAPSKFDAAKQHILTHFSAVAQLSATFVQKLGNFSKL